MKTALLAFTLIAVVVSPAVAAEKKPAPKKDSVKPAVKWRSLFDGKSLKGWKKTKFGGEGEVKVSKGTLVLGVGADMTGVTSTHKNLPTNNYEVELEAMRVDGGDFFCGLTFPVGKKHLSLIVGGWGGGVSGISSIDGNDASENETTTYRMFKKKTWYKIKLRITSAKVEAWLDGKQIVDQKLKGRKLSIRTEVELSKPFGFSTWQTTGALRNIRIRTLDKAGEKKKSDSPKK